MIVRNPWTAETAPQQRTRQWLGQVDPALAANDPELAGIQTMSHELAAMRAAAYAQLMAMDWGDADTAANDPVYQSILAQLQSLTDQFTAAIRQRDAETAATCGGGGCVTLATYFGDLLSSVAQLPGVVLKAPGQAIGDVGAGLVGGIVPWVLLGGLVLVAVTQAEKTRTYRKLVA